MNSDYERQNFWTIELEQVKIEKLVTENEIQIVQEEQNVEHQSNT